MRPRVFESSPRSPTNVHLRNGDNQKTTKLPKMSGVLTAPINEAATLTTASSSVKPTQSMISAMASSSNGSRIPVDNTAPNSSRKRKGSPSLSLLRDRNPSLSVDHTSDDEAGSTSNRAARESKRTRVHFSCVECHRRKQKCDRKEPCLQCIARKVPHLCRPFLNGVEDPDAYVCSPLIVYRPLRLFRNSDVSSRLGAIESLLSRLVSSFPQTTPPARAIIQPAENSSPDVSTLTASGEEFFHPRSADIPRQILPSKPPPSGLFPSKSSGRGFGWGLQEGRMISLNMEENPDLKEVLGTLKESGISKGHLEWVIAGVPGKRMADGLVTLYFRRV